MNCDCNGNFVGFSTICALWTSEGSCVHLLWLWSKACLLLEGRRLRGLLSYSEWVTVPVFINNDCNLKSFSYWRPCGLLNYLMVCSAVNEWRLLCPSFINYDCDPKSAFCWRPCGFLKYLMVLSALNEGRLLCVSTMIIIKLCFSLEVGISTIWCREWVKDLCLSTMILM